MKDEAMTRQQLIEELGALRRRVTDLEAEVTERKRMGKALLASRDLMDRILNTMLEAIVVVDASYKIVDVNNCFLRQYGGARGEVIGHRCYEVTHRSSQPCTDPGCPCPMESIMKTKSLVQMEHVHKDREGNDVVVEFHAFPLFRREGEVEYVIEVIRDITERKRTEETLRKEQHLLASIFDSVQDGISVLDNESQIESVNQTMEQWYAHAMPLVGKKCYEAYHGRDKPCEVCPTRRTLKTGETGHEIVPKRGANGEVIGWVELYSFPLVDTATGESKGTIEYARDITERKRAEEEKASYTRRTEALYTVAQTVSQNLELNSMLGSILRKVAEVLRTDTAALYLLDVAEKAVLLKAHEGMSEEVARQLGRIELGDEELHKVLEGKDLDILWSEIYSEAALRIFAEAVEKHPIQSFASVPVWLRGQLHGVLAVASQTQHDFDPEDLGLLQAIGNEIGIGIQNAMLFEQTSNLAVTDELTGLYNRRHFYEVLETEIYRAQRYGHSSSLVILDLDGFKEYNDRFGHTSGDNGLKLFAQVLKTTLRKSDLAFRYGGDEFTIILPETHADRVKRIIDRTRSKWLETSRTEYAIRETPIGFSAGIAQLPDDAETADGLVFLADTALFHAKRQEVYKSTLVSELETLPTDVLGTAALDQVYALAATVDAKDPYTYGHSRRVATISEMMGKAVGLSRKELADLHAASLLHDIGKVGVRDSILTKPNKLAKDEWELMKTHSSEGSKIVGHVRELAGVVPMILHHHEWYNGTGYPHGLKGKDIPLGARIISIADAYDTMTTPRLYKDIMSQEEAIEELRRCSGTQFDPELVETFRRAMNEATRQD